MKFRDKINGGWSGAMEWEGQRRPVNVGTRKLASHRRSSFHRGGMELKDRQRRAAAPEVRVQSVNGVCGACERYRSSILRYPSRVCIFFLFFNSKYSRYVREYPGSILYLSSIWYRYGRKVKYPRFLDCKYTMMHHEDSHIKPLHRLNLTPTVWS
jgi:hypothetical protein